MEEEKMFECPPGLNWQSAAVVGGSSPADQVQPGFLHLNWESSMDHSAAQFESALSSMVSSPSNPTPPPADSVIIRELIGRLGSICHAGEISPQSHQYMIGGNNSASTSCYSTPLNSPPKLNLSVPDHHLTVVGGGGVPNQGNPAVPPLPSPPTQNSPRGPPGSPASAAGATAATTSSAFWSPGSSRGFPAASPSRPADSR